MTWFKVDDSFYDHPKTMGVSLAARGLWTVCGSYAARHLTDGFVSDLTITMFGGSKADTYRRELIDAGLWKPATGGIEFHDWPEYQPSRESVLAERAAARERQRRAREASRAKRDRGVTDATSHGVSHAVTAPELTDGVTGDVTDDSHRESRAPRPDPTRPVVPTELQGRAPSTPRRSAERPIPDDWQPTQKHRAYAAANGLDLDREAFKFRNHAHANDRRQRQWDATFTTWLAKAVEYAPKRPALAERTDLPECWR